MYYNYGTYDNPIAILPMVKVDDAATTINPANPDTSHWCYDEGQTALVLTKVGDTKPSRVATTFGYDFNDSRREKVGDSLWFAHDQTGRRFGRYVVTGIRRFRDGKSDGEVPSKALRWAVFK